MNMIDWSNWNKKKKKDPVPLLSTVNIDTVWFTLKKKYSPIHKWLKEEVFSNPQIIDRYTVQFTSN